MIKDTFETALSSEQTESDITDSAHVLVVLRKIIPWEKIVSRQSRFYSDSKGPVGKSPRIMAALLIIARLRGLSDREVVIQVKENRYIDISAILRTKDSRLSHIPPLFAFSENVSARWESLSLNARFSKRFAVPASYREMML
ncbi:transposase [Desulfococcaceae bacterium HSG9]|nr:transposase [Desulfococcaceae bacterium HSG9]